MRSPTPGTLATFVLIHAMLGGSPLAAWSPASQEAIVRDAARLAPPDLARQLGKYGRELAAGALEPFAESDSLRHVKNEDGSGAVDVALAQETEAAIDAIVALRSFAVISRRLGRVAHWAADLNNPLNSSASDADEGRYFRDYLLYADSARPRFAVVFYQNRAPLAARADVARLASEALARGRELYPLIGLEYRRIGFATGQLAFDDRSTAYGVAAVAYSHAVTDAARLFRYIWLRAGGTDPRRELERPRDRILLLERAAP